VGKQIRNLGVFLVVIYTALFVQLNRWTVFDAKELQEKPGNNREIERDFSAPRGSVSTADGVVIAESVPSDDRFELQRVYPKGDTYAHVTGYYGFGVGSAGLEKEYNDELAGRTIDFDLQDLGDLFVDRERVGNLTLSIRDNVQEVARQALGDREGSVVALDPRTGAIYAMWSNPSFDPNALSTHDLSAANAVNEQLNADENEPKLSRVYQQRFFPGSTFKVVTGSAGIEEGGVTNDSPVYETATSYTPPNGGRALRNFGGNSCGGTLFVILQQSCNSAFAEMGVEQVGGQGMIDVAQAYGFNDDEVPIDLPSPAESVFPTSVTREDTGEEQTLDQNQGVLAQLSIGQNGVSSTPLQMAMVAAGVANDGKIMEPYVVQEVRDDQDEVIDEADPSEWRTAISSATAETMREAMVSVVQDGSAVRLDDEIQGYVVGGKTGTAQLGTDPPRSHAWIIGFAGPPGETPHVAVAVIVEGQPGASEQTGGEVAAPIGAQVLRAVLEPGTPPPDQSGQPEQDD
jgi:peptidoglycan glycosyltransferase